MIVKLVADVRERWFFEVEGIEEEVESRSLPLGDFVIDINGFVAVLVERKTMADLWASIRDSRHREQLGRLRQAREAGVRVIYLIEGSLSQWADEVERRSVRTAFTNIMLRDGIPVWFTLSPSESRDALMDMATRVASHPEWITTSVDEEDLPKTAQLAPRRTVSNPLDVMSAMLTAIPRVSTKTAKALLDHFKPRNIEELARSIRERGLADVRVAGRKLSASAATSLEVSLIAKDT